MNIVFLSRLFYPHIGGVETHVKKLSQELLKHNHTLTIISSQYDESLPLQQTHQNLNIQRIPKNSLTSKSKLWYWMLTHKQLFTNSQIVHVHDIFWWYLPLKILNPYKNVYTTLHGWEGHFPPTINAKLWKKIAFKLSKSSLVVGNYINKWYQINCPNITYGATDQKPLPLPKKPNLLVYGRLDPDNNIELVLKSLELIKKRQPSLDITFLGDGKLAPQAKKLGKVVGFTPDTSSYLKKSSLVISSSYLSMLDAFAVGRYVSSVYSNHLKKDYLKNHPLSQNFFITPNPELLAKNILSVIKYPNSAQSHIIKAQQWALKQSWSHLASIYTKLWNKQ